MQRIAFGELGMGADEFWNSTFREFYNRLEGHRHVQDMLQKQEWNRARYVAMYTAIWSRADKVDPAMYNFPWEKQELVYTEDERKRITEEALRKHGSKF